MRTLLLILLPLGLAKADLTQELDQALTRGVDYLLSDQNKNGSWGAATQTKGLNIYAPLPGAHHAFRIGTSGLALQGLLESKDRRPQTLAAIDKAEQFLLDQLPRLRRADLTTTYNVWGHAYGLRALTALHKHRAGNHSRQAALVRLAEQQIAMLVRYEDVNGGWGYLDFDSHTQKPSGIPTPFTTATVLLAMHEAQLQMNLKLPEVVVKRGLRHIRQCETPDGSYVYSYGHWKVPRRGINRPAGSLARSQACHTAQRAFGDERITDQRLLEWLDRLTKRDGWLSIGRKRPIPHETHFQISGYFYYYGHYYASEAFLILPENQRAPLREPLARLLLDKQEKDGAWWDYPLYSYHKPYGTGYALTTLARYRFSANPALPRTDRELPLAPNPSR
ncbi:MAG: prenyltransferase/squalene oxidase repeat-containing protein [Verrucomicrobiota bacterium]